MAICLATLLSHTGLQGLSRLQLTQSLVRALCLDCRQLPSHCVFLRLFPGVCVRVHTGVCLHGEALGGRWVGRGKRERERGREGGL